MTDFSPAERQPDAKWTAYLLTWRTTDVLHTVMEILGMGITDPTITLAFHDDTSDATVTVRVSSREDMLSVAHVFDIPYTA